MADLFNIKDEKEIQKKFSENPEFMKFFMTFKDDITRMVDSSMRFNINSFKLFGSSFDFSRLKGFREIKNDTDKIFFLELVREEVNFNIALNLLYPYTNAKEKFCAMYDLSHKQEKEVKN